MTTFNKTLLGTGTALIALVSFVLPISFAHAADLPLDGGGDWYVDYAEPVSSGGGDWYVDYAEPVSSGGGDWYVDYAEPVSSGGGDWYVDYAEPVSSYGGSSYGGSSGFKMPSFGGSSANQSYRESYSYPVYNTPKSTPSNTTVNTCVNNSCNQSYVDNSIVDNSVKISNSFNESKKQREHEYEYQDCYNSGYGYEGYGYNQGYGYNDYGYGYDQGYNQGYNYDDCYVAPIAYNQTPYITLSQAPYTGLDLGPMGEVLYWTFLVLWCLAAAYLIVVKRVQNKVVSYLNGFLFGAAASTTVAHTTTTHAPKAHAAASAPLVEEGIDPFIASQIAKRS